MEGCSFYCNNQNWWQQYKFSIPIMEEKVLVKLVSSIQHKSHQLIESEKIAKDNPSKFSVNCALSIRRNLNQLARQLAQLTEE